MKRKRTPESEPEGLDKPADGAPVSEALIPETLIEDTRRQLEAARQEKPKPCVVCGEPCSPGASEGLCWVCRRLKFSAWRDSDTQMPAQE